MFRQPGVRHNAAITWLAWPFNFTVVLMANPLRNLMHATFTFGDGMKNAGLTGETRVHLSRDDGLRLLKMVTQCDSPMIELHALDRFTVENGYNCLSFAGLRFCWPSATAAIADSVDLADSGMIDVTPNPKLLN